MMQFTPQQTEEMLQALAKYPNGVSMADLYKKCYGFDGKEQLIVCMRRAVLLGRAFLKDSLYFRTPSLDSTQEAVAPTVTDEIQALMVKATGITPHEVTPSTPVVEKQPRVFVATAKYTTVEPIEVPKGKLPEKAPQHTRYPATIRPAKPAKPKVNRDSSEGYGYLQPNACRGHIGYAIFMLCKEKALSAKEIERHVDISAYGAANVYNSFWSLVNDGYANSSIEGGVTVYRWGTKYVYPFRYKLATDADILQKQACISTAIEPEAATPPVSALTINQLIHKVHLLETELQEVKQAIDQLRQLETA